ncbi:hypothetical protein [Fluviicola sp.]|uniref:hypothetical protein n=1 Tax=Fluviicola sp. TaxID=1917219 RepID=UPI0026383526|nr:hypothetical protein [Fluviicola sp.]
MINKKLFKAALVGVVFIFSNSVNAQFKFSRVNVADGVKTVVKSGDKVDMRISPTGNVEQNFVVDLDIAAFRKAYKYDVVVIAYLRNDKMNYSYLHEFESVLNTKKYGGKGIVPIYAYDNKKFKETDYKTLAKDFIEYEGATPISRKVAVYGCYITGEEGYFDANDTYQFRNKYSEGELLGYIELNTVYNKKQIEDFNAKQKAAAYNQAERDIDNMQSQFKRNVTENVEQYLAPVVATPIYGALSEGLKEIWDWRVKAVQAVKSPENADKFIASVADLGKDLEIMYAISKKDKAILKTMNKEIKAITTTQGKWDYVKSKQ